MREGVLAGVAGRVGLFLLTVIVFNYGRSSVANNCDAYGKSQIGSVVYVCSKQP